MSAKKICGIYQIVHVGTGKKYVGRSVNVNDRIRDHQLGGNGLIFRVIAEYGWHAFCWSVLEECDRPLLRNREIFWIKEMDCIYPNGFNLLSAGAREIKTSEETRRKISEARKGKKFSIETIAKRVATRLANPNGRGYKLSAETIAKREATKRSNGSVGWKWNDEQKAAQSARKTGSKPSLETREKLSKAHLGVPRSAEIRAAISIGRIRENAKRKHFKEMQAHFIERSVFLEFPPEEK